MKIGDRVKPVETFNFRVFIGPKDLNDRGTVMDFDHTGDPYVQWDNGTPFKSVHVQEGSEYYRDNLNLHGVCEPFANFGVELAND